MIEIAIHDIQKYDMVQVLQQAEQGEQVVLNHNGKQYFVTPKQNELDKERELAFDEFFKTVQVKLPPDFKFNREELYDDHV